MMTTFLLGFVLGALAVVLGLLVDAALRDARERRRTARIFKAFQVRLEEAPCDDPLCPIHGAPRFDEASKN